MAHNSRIKWTSIVKFCRDVRTVVIMRNYTQTQKFFLPTYGMFWRGRSQIALCSQQSIQPEEAVHETVVVSERNHIYQLTSLLTKLLAVGDDQNIGRYQNCDGESACNVGEPSAFSQSMDHPVTEMSANEVVTGHEFSLPLPSMVRMHIS